MRITPEFLYVAQRGSQRGTMGHAGWAGCSEDLAGFSRLTRESLPALRIDDVLRLAAHEGREVFDR